MRQPAKPERPFCQREETGKPTVFAERPQCERERTRSRQWTSHLNPKAMSMMQLVMSLVYARRFRCQHVQCCVHLHSERSSPLKAPKCPSQSRRSSTTTLHCCCGLMACFLPACCVPCKTADPLVSRAARTARKGLPWALNRIP